MSFDNAGLCRPQKSPECFDLAIKINLCLCLT